MCLLTGVVGMARVARVARVARAADRRWAAGRITPFTAHRSSTALAQVAGRTPATSSDSGARWTLERAMHAAQRGTQHTGRVVDHHTVIRDAERSHCREITGRHRGA